MRRATREGDGPAYPVAGVRNVLEFLSLLEGRRSLKLTEVSGLLGVSPSAAHRMLAMFLEYGFLSQERPGKGYVLGHRLRAFAHTVSDRERHLARMRPALEDLAASLNETVHIAALHGRMVVYLDCIESRKSERATPRTGRALPAYATASGKALLSALAPERLYELFPSCELAPLTRHTMTTRDDLFADIRRTRDRGFAVNENESQLGYFSCSCVVGSGTSALAIVLAAPSARFRKRRTLLTERIREAALAFGAERTV